VPSGKNRSNADSSAAGWLRKAWAHREPVLWAAVIALVVTVQWPMVKGWYYRATGLPEPAAGVAWQTDLGTAMAQARSTHKRVLVDFSASWCPPCVAMKHEVWPDPDVRRAIEAGYVPLAVDADQDNGLSARYQVEGIPAILVLDASGQVVKRRDGYLGRAGMMAFLGGS
jgi:thiol:disulfide interchange protein